MEEEIKKLIEKEIKKADIGDLEKELILRDMNYFNRKYEELKKAITTKDTWSILRNAAWLERAYLNINEAIDVVKTHVKPETAIKLEELRKKIEDYYYDIIENASSRLEEIVK